MGHPRRTEHWSLAAISTEEVHVFEIIGNSDTFTYAEKVVNSESFLTSGSLLGGCSIGSIPNDKLRWLGEKLKEVKVIRHKTEEWDCQNWVMDSIWMLKSIGGAIDSGVNERYIRKELEAEKERWEVADDILFERLMKRGCS